MMKKISDSELLQKYNESIRARRNYSNCYMTPDYLEDMTENGKIDAYEAPDTLILIEKAQGRNNLYYFADSWNWFISPVWKQYREPVVVSIVLNTALPSDDFQNVRIYKTYRRMRCIQGNVPNLTKAAAEYCDMRDYSVLRKMMDETFDVLSDHIPEDSELYSMIEHKQIICYRVGGRAAGFIIFEDKGKTSYIRMVCIDREWRGTGIGNILMNMYFSIHAGYKSFTLWHDIENAAAVSLYKKWGYSSEEIYNYIITL